MSVETYDNEELQPVFFNVQFFISTEDGMKPVPTNTTLHMFGPEMELLSSKSIQKKSVCFCPQVISNSEEKFLNSGWVVTPETAAMASMTHLSSGVRKFRCEEISGGACECLLPDFKHNEEKPELMKEVEALRVASFQDLSDGEKAGLKGEPGEPLTWDQLTDEQKAALRGPKGDPFEFSDFTPEQLQIITGPRGATGPKGDPLTFSDLTLEQIALLTGPRGEMGPALTFENLTMEQIELLRGPKGDPGLLSEEEMNQIAQAITELKTALDGEVTELKPELVSSLLSIRDAVELLKIVIKVGEGSNRPTVTIDLSDCVCQMLADIRDRLTNSTVFGDKGLADVFSEELKKLNEKFQAERDGSVLNVTEILENDLKGLWVTLSDGQKRTVCECLMSIISSYLPDTR